MTVASHEVSLVRICVSHVLCHEAAVPDHLRRSIAVRGRIDSVQSVCQYADRGQIFFRTSSVCVYVYSVCKTANNKNIS